MSAFAESEHHSQFLNDVRKFVLLEAPCFFELIRFYLQSIKPTLLSNVTKVFGAHVIVFPVIKL